MAKKKSKCGKEISCGHQCMKVRSHEADCSCWRPCRFVSPCGHKCIYRCSTDIKLHGHGGVCMLPCNLVCLHGKKCWNRCGKSCSPCLWQCPQPTCKHGSCSFPCSNWSHCEWPQACTEPCAKKCMDCMAKCHGLCGHPCPPCPECYEMVCPISSKSVTAEGQAYTLKDCK